MSWPSPWPRNPVASKPSAKAKSPRPRSPPPQTPLPAASKPASTPTSSARARSPPPQAISSALSTRPAASQRLHTAPPTLQYTTVTTTQVTSTLGGPQYVRLAPQEGPLGRGHYFTSPDGSMEFYAVSADPTAHPSMLASPPRPAAILSTVPAPVLIAASVPIVPVVPLEEEFHPQFVQDYGEFMRMKMEGDESWPDLVERRNELVDYL
ncbi:hypothetical protein LTR95_018756, partial [Oleoguttula sp. CCFEE 5521]